MKDKTIKGADRYKFIPTCRQCQKPIPEQKLRNSGSVVYYCTSLCGDRYRREQNKLGAILDKLQGRSAKITNNAKKHAHI